MIDTILDFVNDFSLKTLIIAFIVFLLTGIIKYPIKKITNKLNESKRLAINSIIVLIPIFLSCIVTVIYCFLIDKTNFSSSHITIIFNSWVLSLSIYAIYERIKLIIKNMINNINDEHLIKQTEKDIKKLISKMKNDEQKIKEIEKHISQLTKEIDLDKNVIDLLTVFNNNIAIANLNNEKNNLEIEIKEIKNELNKS